MIALHIEFRNTRFSCFVAPYVHQDAQFKYYNMFALLSSTETKIDSTFGLYIMPKGSRRRHRT